MGVCCQTQRAPYEKPVELEKNQSDDIARTTSISPLSSPNSSNSNKPMLAAEKKFTNGAETISEMPLCDENTSALCDLSLKLIEALSIYHSFIHHYPQTNTSDNICDMVYNQMTKYNLMQLRADSHHILTYHEDNRKFMKALYSKLMEMNDENGIDNLLLITTKIDEDQQERYYFGHTGDEETNMITALNQIHHDITFAYAHGSDDDEDNGSMTSIRSIDDGGDSMNEMEDSDDSMNVINDSNDTNDSNEKMMGDDMDDMGDTDDTDDEQAPVPVNIKDKLKIGTNKNEKRGYTKGKMMDDDMDEMIEEKKKKKKRKVGRLKRKKKAEKTNDDHKYSGKQKILDDDSWMDKKHEKKKSNHVPSESIQMLGNTKLVTSNSFKQMSLGALEENELDDLANFNEFDMSDGIDPEEQMD